ncbi:hypothetical protein MTP99_006541 [Tenebrio molitor]|jgi:hypothetical protein|nr:hypothetical protein MTP99_006541 [Tenebrio molitor]
MIGDGVVTFLIGRQIGRITHISQSRAITRSDKAAATALTFPKNKTRSMRRHRSRPDRRQMCDLTVPIDVSFVIRNCFSCHTQIGVAESGAAFADAVLAGDKRKNGRRVLVGS